MKKVHAGCGPIYIDGWINADISKDYKTDYCGNITDMLLEEGSAEFIWCCHMLEHLEYPNEVMACLEVFYYWLAPGKVLRLAVPDLYRVASYYVSGSDKLFEIYGDAIDDQMFHKGRAEIFNYFMKGWEHTIVFDFELLSQLLQKVGFKNIAKHPFGQSRTGPWPHDRFELESMYVEADK